MNLNEVNQEPGDAFVSKIANVKKLVPCCAPAPRRAGSCADLRARRRLQLACLASFLHVHKLIKTEDLSFINITAVGRGGER
jgi:hypothetical protein